MFFVHHLAQCNYVDCWCTLFLDMIDEEWRRSPMEQLFVDFNPTYFGGRGFKSVGMYKQSFHIKKILSFLVHINTLLSTQNHGAFNSSKSFLGLRLDPWKMGHPLFVTDWLYPSLFYTFTTSEMICFDSGSPYWLPITTTNLVYFLWLIWCTWTQIHRFAI